MSNKSVSSQGVPAQRPIVGRALLVSNDSGVVRKLTRSLQQFAISSDVCVDPAIAVALVNTRKFEAIIIDLALGERVKQVLERVRLSPSNQNSVTFALVDSREPADRHIRSNFVMQKPLSDGLVESTLRAALGLIIYDYRRYFRCPLEIPIVLSFGEVKVPCKMINISQGGLAVHTKVPFKPGTQVRAEFTLPGETMVFDMNAEICWCDGKSRVGIEFQTVSSEKRFLLQNWLSRKIEQGLPETIAQFFQKRNDA